MILVEELALLSFEVLLVLALAVASVIAFLKLSTLLIKDQIQSFDVSVSAYIFSFESVSMTSIMKKITFFSNVEFAVFPVILITLYFLFIKPHRWYSIKVPVVAIGSISFNLILKRIFDRPRPFLEHVVQASGLSFPSGHAMFSFSFYGLIIYIIWNSSINKYVKWAICTILSLLILMIGVSRVYLKVHFPSDVLAGFCAGFIWLVISILTIKTIEILIRNKEQNKKLIPKS